MLRKCKFIIDTNFFWNVIELSKELNIPYTTILDDIGLYLSENDATISIPDKILTELQQIGKIKDFDRYLQTKRTGDPRWNFFTIEATPKNKEYRKILQPLFKGNLDNETGLINAEKADHELLVCALDMANRIDLSVIIIISDDYQVLDTTATIKSIIKQEKEEVLNRIIAYPSFIFFGALLLSRSNYKTNITKIEESIFQKYNELRKKQRNDQNTIGWMRKNQELLIKTFARTFPEIQNLRSKIDNLTQENEKYRQIVDKNEKKTTIQEQYETKLTQIVDLIIKNEITEEKLKEELIENKLVKFENLLLVFDEIIKNKDTSLIQQFFRGWGKVLAGADRTIALNIRKELYSTVFKTLIEPLEENFRKKEIDSTYNLYSVMIPLEIEMDWKKIKEKELLEKYYIIGLYLSLLKNRLDEFKQIIEIINNANIENVLENTTLGQFINFRELFDNQEQEPELTKIFKANIVKNVEELYKNKLWNGVWYLLLPIYNYLTEEERKRTKKILENTFWVTMKPPTELEKIWEQINTEYEIIKGNNVGQMLHEEDIAKIKEKTSLPEFLQGRHLVVGQAIGRAHVVIHLPTRNRRIGIQIQDEKTNLQDCLEIEFTENSIQDYFKISSSYQEEQREQLSGILKLKKNPELKKVIRETSLKNLIL